MNVVLRDTSVGQKNHVPALINLDVNSAYFDSDSMNYSLFEQICTCLTIYASIGVPTVAVTSSARQATAASAAVACC